MPRIPFEGSEFEPPQVRAQQADGLSRSMKNELTALRTLTEGHCESSPILIAEKLGLQGNDGLVPQGFMLYMLMNELPGVWLGQYTFGISLDPYATTSAMHSKLRGST